MLLLYKRSFVPLAGCPGISPGRYPFPCVLLAPFRMHGHQLGSGRARFRDDIRARFITSEMLCDRPGGEAPPCRARPLPVPPVCVGTVEGGKDAPAAPRVWQYISLPRGAEATGGAYLENRILRGERPCLEHGRSPGDRT